MERRDRSSNTTVRIPDGLLKRIEEDVENSGEFASRADWIIAAIRHYIDYREELMSKRKKAFAAEEDFVSHTLEKSIHKVKNE